MCSDPCKLCITKSMCMNKTMQEAMKLCPEYLKYIEMKANDNMEYYYLLKEYTYITEMEIPDE